MMNPRNYPRRSEEKRKAQYINALWVAIGCFAAFAIMGIIAYQIGFAVGNYANEAEREGKYKIEKQMTRNAVAVAYIDEAVEEEIQEENENELISKALYELSTDGGTFSATAYCKCRKCCGKWSDVPGTYTGAEPVEGVTVAVDPAVIPLNSVVFVETADGEIHEYVAQDIGGAIKGNKIDIYCETHEGTAKWGRQDVKVRWTPPDVSA